MLCKASRYACFAHAAEGDRVAATIRNALLLTFPLTRKHIKVVSLTASLRFDYCKLS